MIQLHRLEGFYWVARTGGYARAARAFPYPITQPAVHQQVKKLEAELGVTLFERVAKDRVQPTPAGARLFEFVRPYFERLPAVVRSIREGDYGGELRIAAATMFVRALLPAWIRRVTRRNPRLFVDVTEVSVPAVDGLRGGEFDLLVDHLPDVPDDLATREIARLHPFLVLPRSHPLAKRRRVDIAELAGDTFVAYNPGLLAHDLQLRALAMHGVTPPQLISGSSAEVILGFVEAELGYSLLPSLDPAGPRGRGVKVFPLEAPRVEYPVVVAWRKDTPENPLLDAFLEAAP